MTICNVSELDYYRDTISNHICIGGSIDHKESTLAMSC